MSWVPLGFTITPHQEYMFYQFIYSTCHFHCFYRDSPVLQIRWGDD